MTKVRDCMTSHCKTVSPQNTIYDAAILMTEHDFGFLPVVDDQNSSKLLGVLTDRDLVVRGYAEKHPGSAPVSEVMSAALVTIAPDRNAEEAADLMATHQIRRLPVVDQGRLIGVVALGDLALTEQMKQEAGEALSEISESESFLQ